MRSAWAVRFLNRRRLAKRFAGVAQRVGECLELLLPWYPPTGLQLRKAALGGANLIRQRLLSQFGGGFQFLES
jgi:hypothetical protein